jgi:hypothetical protein
MVFGEPVSTSPEMRHAHLPLGRRLIGRGPVGSVTATGSDAGNVSSRPSSSALSSRSRLVSFFVLLSFGLAFVAGAMFRPPLGSHPISACTSKLNL